MYNIVRISACSNRLINAVDAFSSYFTTVMSK